MKLGLINTLKPKSAFLDAKSSGSFSSEILSGGLQNKKNGYLNSGANNTPNTVTTLTFTGIRSEKILQGAQNFAETVRNAYLKRTVSGGFEISDYSKFVKNTNKAVGDGFVESYVNEFRRRMGAKSSEFLELNDNKLIVHDKNLLGKLAYGLSDVAKLPIDIFGGLVTGLGKVPKLKDMQFVKNLADLPVLQDRKKQKETMELFYKIKGFGDYIDNPSALKKAILKVPKGNAVGNYNTKDERGLNRLATGAVSSLFVGTDFYNLVMYEKNNKQEAKAAGNKRVKREMMRIGISAFMTYTVLGSLSSYVNKSKALACAAIAGSSLFSEVVTRLVAGVPLHPLTPEGAREYNKKRAKKGKAPAFENKMAGPEAYKNISLMPENKTNIFANAVQNPAFVNFATNENPKEEKSEKDAKTQDENKNKSPITLKRLGYAVLGALAFDVIYGVTRSKIPAFDNLLRKAAANFDKFYERNTKSELILTTKELKHFLKGFDGTHLGGVKKSYEGIFDIDYRALNKQVKHLNEDYAVITDPTAINSIFNRKNEGRTAYNLKGITVKLEEVVETSRKGTMITRQAIPGEITYNFGRVQEKKIKPLADAALYPLKAIKSIIKLPAKPLIAIAKKAAPPPKPQEPAKFADIGELYHDCNTMYKRYRSGKISLKEFQKYVEFVNTKPLNTDTSAKYPQTALASLSRNFVTLISSYFFINDFRNEILIQSNGKNTQKASEVTKERTAHKLSNFILNKFFMELFNSTFSKQYLSSLAGATVVAAATEVTNESTVRLSIGVPVDKKSSKEEIDEFEKKHIEKKGLVGAYYRFMARLTGKKMLSER